MLTTNNKLKRIDGSSRLHDKILLIKQLLHASKNNIKLFTNSSKALSNVLHHKDNKSYLPFLDSLFGQRQQSLKMLFWIPTLFKLLCKYTRKQYPQNSSCKPQNHTQTKLHQNNHIRGTPGNSQQPCILSGVHQPCKKAFLQQTKMFQTSKSPHSET